MCGVLHLPNAILPIHCSCGFKHVTFDAILQLGVEPLQTTSPCLHRSAQIADLDCGCSGQPKLYHCNLLNVPCIENALAKPWASVKVIGIDKPTEKPRSCGTCDRFVRVVTHPPGKLGSCKVINHEAYIEVKHVEFDAFVPFCEADKHWVCETIDSLLLQENAAGWIHVVADNTDSTAIRAKYKDNPRVLCYEADGIGPYRIANALFNYRRTDIISIVDADDPASSDRMARAAAILNLGFDCVSGSMEQFVDEGSVGNAELIERMKWPILPAGRVYTNSPKGAHVNSARVIKAAAFERVGGFAPWPMSADFDFDNRLNHTDGLRSFYSGEIWGRRRLHNKSLSNCDRYKIGSEERVRWQAKVEANLAKVIKGIDAKEMGGLADENRDTSKISVRITRS